MGWNNRNALMNCIWMIDEEETYWAHYPSLELWRTAGFVLWDWKQIEDIKPLDRMRAFYAGWLVYP